MDHEAKKQVLEKLIALMSEMEVDKIRPPKEEQPKQEMAMLEIEAEDSNPEMPSEEPQQPSEGSDDEAHMLERLKEEYSKLC